ncbi:hypothetical protein M3650_24580 [Paenibacillus sp. MER TA 81-3]|uniref:hypothetical protein n=1 Tax=Paenibacillus sp. MER TA 81-3 TaxID=2939573 RepID=UPI00203C6BCA|nr:hypothetical protein [Paenibacillus sp. MER TA 81-3]MCM3341713.1 hypothetical protein [Paenibacillus sp. MER TA 81-3]
MHINRLAAFLGRPVSLDHGIRLYSPLIDDIAEVGEHNYYIYLLFCSFDKEKIFKDVFRIDDDRYSIIESADDYELLTLEETTKAYLCNALSFFTKDDVQFDSATRQFVVDGRPFLTKENYRFCSRVIQELNGQVSEAKAELKPKNNKAKIMFEKLKRARRKYNDAEQNALELKDILSILCSAEGNDINVFNVGRLTVYQAYEQFERIGLKESHNRMLPVWANGYMKENDQLPEWIVKSKL